MGLDHGASSELARSYAQLKSALQAELGHPPLVLPNAKFFPDTFTGDEASLRRLLARMQQHAGISDIPVRAALVDEEAPAPRAGGGCGTGACASDLPALGTPRVIDEGNSWVINVPVAELRHPGVLTANIARCLASIFLVESLPADHTIAVAPELAVELVATQLGFGVLLLEVSHIYSKGCGGPSVAKLTSLNHEQLALVLALFAESEGQNTRSALRELAPTQQDALKEALEFTRVNRELLSALVESPERVASGRVRAVDPSKTSPLGWLFGKKKSAGDAEPDFDSLEAALAAAPEIRSSAPKRPRNAEQDELRALVDEALQAEAGSSSR